MDMDRRSETVSQIVHRNGERQLKGHGAYWTELHRFRLPNEIQYNILMPWLHLSQLDFD